MKYGYRWAAIAFAAGLMCAANAGAAKAATFKTLYNFCPVSDCADGRLPITPLAEDANGNFFGMTQHGGNQNAHCTSIGCGVIYELKGRKEKAIYSFCKKLDCSDGFEPAGKLVVDTAGNLYGVTSEGGKHGAGTVFELTTTHKLITLYSFCKKSGCPDGNDALQLTYQGQQSGAFYDGASPLYGVAVSGGAHNDAGAIFRLQLSGGKWSQKVLYNFCSIVPSCSDGMGPSGVFSDASGTLYGTTLGGNGTVFKFQGTTLTTLYTFCSQADCADGKEPFGSGVMDGNGNFYGIAALGGSIGVGVIYELDSSGAFTKLHDFCANEELCTDGYSPRGDLYADGNGNLFGTTPLGGQGQAGTIFEYSGSNYQVLYSFCDAGPPCTDGASPQTTLVPDGKGNLLGSTGDGGTGHQNLGGTIFEITP